MAVVVHYFNAWGRGERIRWILMLGDIEFTDQLYKGKVWIDARDSIEFRQLPVVEIDGHTLVQSLVIERYISRKLQMSPADPYQEYLVDSLVACFDDYFRDWANYLVYTTNLEGYVEYFTAELLPNFRYVEKRLEENGNNGFAVGSSRTLADFAIAEFIYDVFIAGQYRATLAPLITANCPRLVDFTNSFIASSSKLSTYLSTRPEMKY